MHTDGGAVQVGYHQVKVTISVHVGGQHVAGGESHPHGLAVVEIAAAVVEAHSKGAAIIVHRHKVEGAVAVEVADGYALRVAAYAHFLAAAENALAIVDAHAYRAGDARAAVVRRRREQVQVAVVVHIPYGHGPGRGSNPYRYPRREVGVSPWPHR